MGAATLGVLVFVVARRGEVKQLVVLLRQSDWRWLALAVLSEGLFQCNEATIYWLMYRVMGHRTRLLDVIRLTLAASFVNRVAPSAGMSGTGIFAERMARKGVPAAASISVNLARYVLDYGAFVLVLAAGMLYLAGHHELTPLELRAALVFGLLLVCVAVVAALLSARRAALQRLLAVTLRALNGIAARATGRRPLCAALGDALVEDVFRGLGVLRLARGRTVWLIITGLLIHVFDLAGLLVVFMAVGYRVHLGVLIAGYGLAYLAGFVSLLPSGLGVFEASMTVVYASLGVPVRTAVLVTILYRVFSLWLPLIAGYGALHAVLRERRKDGR